MSDAPARVVLLGSQQGEADVTGVLDGLGLHGAVGLVTAGWQEWEADDRGAARALGERARNLLLYERAERVWAEDPEVRAEHRRMQSAAALLRRSYNARLAHAMGAWIAVESMDGDTGLLDDERADALAAVRALDARQVERVSALRAEFAERLRLRERPAVAREREQVRRSLEGVEAVVVEGGHVASLLNRLRLFGVGEELAGRTVIACAGGAMALSGRLVLFHDTPPWGPGHAEVAEAGLGLFPGVVALPGAGHRLRLDDVGRVSRLARRLAPDIALVLDPGARLDWDGTRWAPGESSALCATGEVRRWETAA